VGGDQKKVDIEQLLTWAYVDELPKRKISSAEGIWDGIAEYGQRGGIDVGHSAAQRYPHFGLPHPDAEEIERAVAALGIISIEEDFDLVVGDLRALVTVNDFKPRPRILGGGKTVPGGGYYEEGTMPPMIASLAANRPRDVLVMRSINVAALVTQHAVMGTRPKWKDGNPLPYQIPARRGPMIIGECRGRNLYTAGSYCPLRWAPSPVEIVLGRADYHLWRRGLVSLAQTLELKEHIALMPKASPAPWLTPEEKMRVLSSYPIARQKPLPLAPQRKRTGSPPKKPKNSKVRSLI
jgi:hypothetical protein